MVKFRVCLSEISGLHLPHPYRTFKPFVEAVFDGGKTFRTSYPTTPADDVETSWADVFSFDYTVDESQLTSRYVTLTIYNQSAFMKTDTLGSCNIDLHSIVSGPSRQRRTIIQHGRHNGTLSFSCETKQYTTVTMHVAHVSLCGLPLIDKKPPTTAISYRYSGHPASSAHRTEMLPLSHSASWSSLKPITFSGTVDDIFNEAILVDVEAQVTSSRGRIKNKQLAFVHLPFSIHHTFVPNEIIDITSKAQYSTDFAGLPQFELKMSAHFVDWPRYVQMREGVNTERGIDGGVPFAAGVYSHIRPRPSIASPTVAGSLSLSSPVSSSSAVAGSKGFCVMCDAPADLVCKHSGVPVCSVKCKIDFCRNNNIDYTKRQSHSPSPQPLTPTQSSSKSHSPKSASKSRSPSPMSFGQAEAHDRTPPKLERIESVPIRNAVPPPIIRNQSLPVHAPSAPTLPDMPSVNQQAPLVSHPKPSRLPPPIPAHLLPARIATFPPTQVTPSIPAPIPPPLPAPIVPIAVPSVWSCAACTYHNAVRLSRCEMCGANKVTDAAPPPAVTPNANVYVYPMTSAVAPSPVYPAAVASPPLSYRVMYNRTIDDNDADEKSFGTLRPLVSLARRNS